MSLKKIKWLITIIIFIYVLSLLVRSFFLFDQWNVQLSKTKNQDVYPIDFLRHKFSPEIAYDSSQVVIVDPSKKSNYTSNESKFYSPIALALRTLSHHSDYLTYHNKEDSIIFMTNVNWLIINQKQGYWYFDTPYKIGDKKLEAPWPSSMAQGLAISVLLRAYKLTADSVYIKAAKDALVPLMTSIKNGGVVSENDFGPFLEEYPYKNGPTHVLNGAIYTLIGIKELCNAGDSLACHLFQQHFDTIKSQLPLFSLNNWSAYSLDDPGFRNHFNYASPWYQKLHIVQLQLLYKITGDEEIKGYAESFKEQHDGYMKYIIYPIYILYQDVVNVNNFIKRTF